MIVGQKIPFRTFCEGTSRYVFLPSGDIREFTAGDVMICPVGTGHAIANNGDVDAEICAVIVYA